MQATIDNPGNEHGASDDIAEYLVHNPLEITRILRGLIQRRELVSAFFNGGADLLLTAVMAVDAAHKTVTLDYGSNEVLNQKLVAADKVIFVTSLDRVKVQFVSREVKRTIFEGRPAFLISMPDQVLQLQRREFYRLATPILNPLKCLIPLETQDAVEAVIFDISAGGVGLLLDLHSPVASEIGSIHNGCRIDLPGIGVLDVAIRVQNRVEITQKNGTQALRCGCQFIALKPSLQSTIQRYIVKLERERIVNTPGH